jgi:hypothetical protein
MRPIRIKITAETRRTQRSQRMANFWSSRPEPPDSTGQGLCSPLTAWFPELPPSHNVMHAKVSDLGEVSTSSSLFKVSILTPAMIEGVVLPTSTISGLNPFTLSDSGLHARRPTHKVRNYFLSSKGLATWWLARPSRTGIPPA